VKQLSLNFLKSKKILDVLITGSIFWVGSAILAITAGMKTAHSLSVLMMMMMLKNLTMTKKNLKKLNWLMLMMVSFIILMGKSLKSLLRLPIKI